MEIRGTRILLRAWQPGDEAALVRHANNRAVSRHLQDRFPYPYTPKDARAWIREVQAQGTPPLNLAIVWQGEPVGGVGFDRGRGLARLTAQVGYWVGEEHWGSGLATEALALATDYAFATFDFERLEATVLEGNPASRRVLAKSGYVLEGRLARSAVKEGRVLDTWLYARLRPR